MGKKGLTKSGTTTSPLCCALSFLCAFGFIINLFGIAPVLDVLNGGPTSRRMAATLAARSSAAVESASPDLLARKESFGFFDDISDEEWRQRQRRARSHQHQVDPADKEVNANTSPNDWYLANYYPLFSCPNQQRVGVGGDGPKWVCDPLRLSARAKEPMNKCLVYSVGCNGNYAFEDGLVDLLGAGVCEIHVFDVKPIYGRPKDDVTKGIHFHGWGLTSSYEKDSQANPMREFLTLQETMEKLGHVGRTIDVFKIDCEGCKSEYRIHCMYPLENLRKRPAQTSQLLTSRYASQLISPRRMDDVQGEFVFYIHDFDEGSFLLRTSNSHFHAICCVRNRTGSAKTLTSASS
jgi:Methyltransferase domain